MARLHATCCCGSSIEARSVFAAPEIAQSWWKLHALCANAWQRERGLDVDISFKDTED